MQTPPRTHECTACGDSLLLFQPTCRRCDTAHTWQYRAACHDCGELTEYTDEACAHCGAQLSIWRALEADALAQEETLELWKDAVPRPIEAGYRLHLGSIRGQWADYRRSLPDGGEFHVLAYAKRYELHHDEVGALDSPGRHLLRHGGPAAVATGIDTVRRTARAARQTTRLAGRILGIPATLFGRSEDEEQPDHRL